MTQVVASAFLFSFFIFSGTASADEEAMYPAGTQGRVTHFSGVQSYADRFDPGFNPALRCMLMNDSTVTVLGRFEDEYIAVYSMPEAAKKVQARSRDALTENYCPDGAVIALSALSVKNSVKSLEEHRQAIERLQRRDDYVRTLLERREKK